MKSDKIETDFSAIDKGLVAMFLKMSPEKRLQSNDNALRTILELRNAFIKECPIETRPKRNT